MNQKQIVATSEDNSPNSHLQVKLTSPAKQTGYIKFVVTLQNGSKNYIWLRGRNAWALRKLIMAGKSGCTPITHVGPRWSAYVHNLRKESNLEIETINEPHGGAYAGTHARYVLRSKVALKEETDGKT